MKWSDFAIKKVKISDKNYPKVLKKIKNPPKLLYYRGNLSKNTFSRSLAIVGSRRATSYGKMVVEKFMPALIGEKITIISGFMYGIDTAAHRECLECGGLTAAVLGFGLDIVYPEENEGLYSEILNSGGVVLSEYEPDFKAKLWTFPARNRIMAGLATLGVLVVEAGEKSGSLITAKYAKKQGKKVFAVPGPITSSNFLGTNSLIKSGEAEMVLTPSDILGEKAKVKIPLKAGQEEKELSLLERKIFAVLEAEPLTVDDLSKKVNKNVMEIGQVLSLMALKGLIIEEKGKYYLANLGSLSSNLATFKKTQGAWRRK